MTYHNGFQARMASGKRVAQDARNRGLSGGKQGWRVFKASDYAPVDQDSFVHLAATTALAWQSVRAEALEGYLRSVFPERYEAFE